MVNDKNSKKDVIFMAGESDQKIAANAGNLRRTILNAVYPGDDAVDMEVLVGYWYFESVELPGTGLRRKAPAEEDYYFEFASNGTVIAHVHGKEYETTYSLTDGCISFGNAELAALKLRLSNNKLRLSNYLGTTLTFVKQ